MTDPERRAHALDRRKLIPRDGGRRATDPPTWVSISEYARIHGLHRNTVAKWVKLAAVECWRKGKIVRVKNQPPAEEAPQ